MKNKLLAILVSLLFLTLIPSVIGEIADSESEDEIIWMRGLIFHKLRKGNYNKCFAIHLVVWYNTSEGLKREVYRFEHLPFIIRDSAYLGRMYEFGLGLFTYIFWFFQGGLETIP